ncbi:MAG: DNA polymerase III subunit beta [Nitrospirae bacterium CG_4_10_14_0_8_um_filter_41_23]|nr:DNA polymerase III subunit beta [Nitrospirota bacterium]OIP59463.1 MAG: DNA polymerase III subunit beta [Nitrospirae bacterium CG2_30_41_42]PIQ93528.1 MAG: DNA polymerase III subunit beta [Nitrospirae bacterium CG11_big_fil_rev_8_21_14_0_20_41_14]PIV44716.1 MAG: DNA polymerase III subunit beta [Nitrospirae bacterium CG02_land_8_20_14_3_00_41_53]PIW87845.1 MAG: DNA polymerase III subunit beta [Nitrospirae bacterium CG_4_8_14_3_um_filter_41_47]PIY87581.1 MAG: DNA polymerase III subunit beta [
MKLSVSKDEMQEKLSNIQNIAEKRNTMPILSHFLLDAGKKGSYIVATDIETALKEPLDVEVEEEGKLCIPARKLLEIVREMEGDLSFESVDEQWLKVRAGSSDFRLACLPPSEFPAWPALGDAEEITIDAPILMEMIEKTIYSAGESDTRYTLNGLLFHVKPQDKSFTIVGTDGHRLALIIRRMDELDRLKEEKKIIVPRKAVSELRRFLPTSSASGGEEKEMERVKILIGEKHLLFSVGSFTSGGSSAQPKADGGVQFLTRLIEGTYPNYENVIPLANEKKMLIERNTFAKVLRRVSVMSRERASAVRFDIGEEKLVVSSSNPDIGEAREEIAVEYKNDKLSLGFNARYVIDVLSAMMTEKVTLELQDPLSPVLLKEDGDENYKCVVMPMRI